MEIKMSNREIEKHLPLIIEATKERTGLCSDFIALALYYVTIDQPSKKAFDAAVNDYHHENQDPIIRIQQLSPDGNVIDEYILPNSEEELDEDNDCESPTIYDQLQNLNRQAALMKAMGDHNYRKIHDEVVALLAYNHIGYEIDNHEVSLNGPLVEYMSNERQEELWKIFLTNQGLSPDIDLEDFEVKTDEQ